MVGGTNGATHQDPGLQYLYSSKSSKPQQQHSTAPAQQEPVLVMAPLPRDPTQPGNSRDWGAAIGNVETAKLALDALHAAIADAVFLDEDAYTNAATLQRYHQRLQSQHRRILQLEAEVEALRVDAGRQQEALLKQRAQTRAAEAQVQELQQELENNAVVFDMHYNELLLKNEEIERLKTVIEGLGGGS